MMSLAFLDLTALPPSVDPMQGALIVIRPDGYVGNVVPLDQPETLLEYFTAFLVPTKQQTKRNGAANGHS